MPSLKVANQTIIDNWHEIVNSRIEWDAGKKVKKTDALAFSPVDHQAEGHTDEDDTAGQKKAVLKAQDIVSPENGLGSRDHNLGSAIPRANSSRHLHTICY